MKQYVFNMDGNFDHSERMLKMLLQQFPWKLKYGYMDNKLETKLRYHYYLYQLFFLRNFGGRGLPQKALFDRWLQMYEIEGPWYFMVLEQAGEMILTPAHEDTSVVVNDQRYFLHSSMFTDGNYFPGVSRSPYKESPK